MNEVQKKILTEAADWIRTDVAYKAPEQLTGNIYIQYIEHLCDAIKRAMELGNGWISREDRLPPRHTDFIALNRDGRIFKSRMCYGMHSPWFTFPEGDKSPSDTMPDWLDVTHWIPMPGGGNE